VLGFESTFAADVEQHGNAALGVRKRRASATRSTDSSVPSKNFATVITAPVFPALTIPSAFASRTRRAATWTELSFFAGRPARDDHSW